MAKNYSNLMRDGSNTAMQTGRGISTVDISGSPKASPYSLSTITAFSVPTNAAEMVIYGSGAVRVTEDSTGTRYFTVPSSTVMAIPLSGTDTIYLVSDSGTITLQFYFVTI